MIIDWDFIRQFEGGRKLYGYVPVNNEGEPIGKSGVTVATGVDLGQYSPEEFLHNLKISPSLVRKLHPYFGVTGVSALQLLKDKPLHLTGEEADLITEHVRFSILKTVARVWGEHSQVPFRQLPPRVRTVLFSLAYNFGPHLDVALPNLLKTAVACAGEKNWTRFHSFLDNFPSKNPELKRRRALEALHIKSLISDLEPGIS